MCRDGICGYFADTFKDEKPKRSVIAGKFFYDLTFYLDIFKKIINTLKDFEKLSCKNKKESIKDYGFQGFAVRGREGNSEAQRAFYVKNTCNVFQSR